ncbi:MAG: ribbon-helix-helix domain-containing protein [Actinomycetia bacterium]|nr:ribbon-helix-helix domain-containing protein [Actinomycetes bacterium]
MGKTTTVRVSNSTKSILEEIAQKTGRSQSRVISDAVEAERRRMILEAGNEAYARLRADEKASKEYDEEFEVWETAF